MTRDRDRIISTNGLPRAARRISRVATISCRGVLVTAQSRQQQDLESKAVDREGLEALLRRLQKADLDSVSRVSKSKVRRMEHVA